MAASVNSHSSASGGSGLVFARRIAGSPSRKYARRMLLKLIKNWFGAGLREKSGSLERAQLLAKTGQLEAALQCYRAWIQTRPDDVDAHVQMGNVLVNLCSIEDAVAAYGRALSLAPESSFVFSVLLFNSHYLASPDPERTCALHRQFGDVMRDRFPPGGARIAPAGDRDRRLRIGYMSPNFSRHSVGYFAEPVIRHHDRSRYEVYCYYTHPWSDKTTERFRNLADSWRDIADAPDAVVAQLIREDRIDILIDLAGHSKWNRLKVFARKPAPVQITWLGYPDTTGLQTMDFRVSDCIADPPGDAERLHTERLLRIDGAFLCYQPPEDSPPVRSPSAAGVVLASFNNASKLNEPMIKVWSQILAQVPEARLILKSARLDCQDVSNRILEWFERNGIEPERIELKGPTSQRSRHLDHYGEVDIALDTFPYNGTTTTCEALWMGVPVVSLAGAVHMSRVGASILRCVGLEEFAAATADEYIATVVALAQDKDRREALRAGIRSRLMASPLLLSYAGGSIPHLVILDRFGKVLASSIENGGYVGVEKPFGVLKKLVASGAAK